MGKFLRNNAGTLEEVLASQTGGAPAANTIPRLDGNGRLDATMMPVGIGADTAVITTGEALSAGDYVNIYNNAGTPNVRKADASNGRTADGFVLSSVANNASATVYFEGTNTAVSGMTPGAFVFLSTAGAGTTTAPTTAGWILQRVGKAITANNVNFEGGRAITLV